MKIFKFFLLSALALALSACSAATSSQAEPTAIPTVKAPNVIIAQGQLEPTRYAEIALNASGLVSEVLVKEGDKVTAGQTLATLKSDEAQTLETAQANASKELTSAFQDLRDAQYKLDEFDVPSDFADMSPTQAVQAMLDKLNAARDAFEPYKYLDERTLRLTPAEEQSKVYRSTAKMFKKQLDDAWADYRKAIQWMQLESDVQNAQARVNRAQKDYDVLQDTSLTEDTAGVRAALANAELRAPFTGVITNLKLKVGEFAASGQPVVTIANIANWVVKTTDLTEIDVVNVKEGEPVTVTLDAIPGVEFKGNVFSIGQNYSKNQGDIVYEVTILLTDQHPAMRWGMTAAVSFQK